MAKKLPVDRAPTMIIPAGTQIQVDAHGQLSIRTPGNLVIQNSGNYGTIESLQGSIRIEPHVQVEAVLVQCAHVCYIQGSLTAWKVKARSIELDRSARAHIILQETESLVVGREARLVGNFASENELFGLFSRFTRQMRALPFVPGRDESDESSGLLRELAERETKVIAASSAVDDSPAPLLEPGRASVERAAGQGRGAAELSDGLFFALVLLERESEKPGGGPGQRKAVTELTRMLRVGDVEGLRRSHQSLLSNVVHASDDLRRVQQLVAEHFA